MLQPDPTPHDEIAKLRRLIRQASAILGTIACAIFVEPGLLGSDPMIAVLRAATMLGFLFFASSAVCEFFLKREKWALYLLFPATLVATLPYLYVIGIGTAESAWLPLLAMMGTALGGARYGAWWLGSAVFCALVAATLGPAPHPNPASVYGDPGELRIYFGVSVTFITILAYFATWASERYYVRLARRFRRANLDLASTVEELEQALAERDSLRDKLVEGQKMESLGLMAGGLAHDFNNLLTGIIGELDLARLDAEGEVLESVELAKESALAASEMTASLLSYTGRAPLRRRKLDPVEVVESVRSIAHSATARSVPIVFDAVEEIGWFEGDHAMVEQVLLNLIINAAEAMKGRTGPVVIEVERRFMTADELKKNRTLAELSPADYVLIKVADSGSGMSAETVSRIFEPFYSSKDGGRGLGLAACVGIVRSHDGGIFVESKVGVGTTFMLAFPATVAPSTLRESQETPTVAGVSRALVVDDRPEVLNAVSRMIESLGLQAIGRSSWAEAIALVEQSPDAYDIAILDVMMPGMRGDELAGRLREIRPDIPVVLMSGYVEPGNFLTDLGGEYNLLSKPIRREELEALLLPDSGTSGSEPHASAAS